MGAVVILLRRSYQDLTDEEITMLKNAFPTRWLKFVTTNPRTHEEHLADCRKHQAIAVVLPTEKPIPETAMRAGFPHLTVQDGQVVKLKEERPVFEPFEER